MNIIVWIIIASIVLAFSFENRRLREEVRLLREEIARRDKLFIDEGNHATIWIGAKTPNAKLDL